jgi:hypothetical protein
MDNQGNKETAESVLREMPGVVGAFVQPDAFGNPREVHLLIRPGPRPREFAQHVRSVLESRLRIPIDQRIISIAQLADEHPADAEPERSGDAVAPIDPRVQLIAVESEVSGTRVLARVLLRHDGVDINGQATELEAGDGRVRAAAMAVIQALNQICGDRLRFGLDFATVIEATGGRHALTSVVATSRHLGRRPVALTGAARIEDDIETAAALATLMATNRVVGFGVEKLDRRLRDPGTER